MQRNTGGKDIVQYATACSDTIPDLQVFKAFCKPIFLILAAGIPVAFVHGADCGKMRQVIREEVENELRVLNGDGSRKQIKLEDAIPESEVDAAFYEQEEDEKRKKNVNSLKTLIAIKKEFK